jgi:hypothetical protein
MAGLVGGEASAPGGTHGNGLQRFPTAATALDAAAGVAA